MKRTMWQPEELSLLYTARGYGSLPWLVKKINRPASTIYDKRNEIERLRAERAVCGAFLPDSGEPYSAVYTRLCG